MDLDFDLFAEDMPLPAIARQAIERGERVGRNRRAQPLNYVAVIVVVRRFDEHEAKAFRGVRRCGRGWHQRRTIHNIAQPDSKYPSFLLVPKLCLGIEPAGGGARWTEARRVSDRESANQRTCPRNSVASSYRQGSTLIAGTAPDNHSCADE